MVQGVVKSEFVDAIDAQASLLRFRPRSQNDGSERSEGECTPQVGLTSGSEGMREAQAYGIRFAGARRTLVCTRGLFFFFDHVAPNPHTLLPPKNLVGWPAFTVQGVVKSEFVDAMDAQASLLRFRPRSQNDGSERSEGECTRRSASPQVLRE